MKLIVRTWRGKTYEEAPEPIDIDAYHGVVFAQYATTQTAVADIVRGTCRHIFMSARENAIVVYVEPPVDAVGKGGKV